jgi:hypothetical protein
MTIVAMIAPTVTAAKATVQIAVITLAQSGPEAIVVMAEL